MDIVLTIHSLNRWLVVAVGVISAVKFLVGWLGKSNYQPLDQRLMTFYTILLDIQLLLGIILLFSGPLVRYRIEHAITMIIALVLAHLSRLWRDKEDPIKFRNNFLAIAIGLLLIVAGVFVLPQGWG
jgi:hypothetical protein